MGFADVNQALASKGVPSSKFDNIGDERSGYLKDVNLQVVTNTEGVVQYQKDGETPKEQLVITWQTEERDPSNPADTGMRKLYCSWRLEAAIRAAFRAAGADGLEPDAFLRVRMTGTEKVQVPNSKMQVNAKTYEVVEYRRPTFKAGATEPDADDEYKNPNPPAAAAAPAVSEDMKALAQKMWDSGIDDLSVIGAATGLSPQAIQSIVAI